MNTNSIFDMIYDYIMNLPQIHGKDENSLLADNVWSYIYHSGIYATLTILFVLFVLMMIPKIKRYVKGLPLYVPFFVVWFFGFILYDIGMYTETPLSLITNIPRALIHAFSIFVFDSDISEIGEAFHHNWVYMSAFSLIHFFAAVISLIFVIKHFGYNIIAGIKLYVATSPFSKSPRETYIFWGLNEASFTLAYSIKAHYEKKKDSCYRIIIIRTQENQCNVAKTAIHRVFDFLSIKNEGLDRIHELEYLTTYTLFDIHSVANMSIVKEYDVLKLMSLRQVGRLVMKTKEKVHCFFLTEDESANIRNVSLLKNDKTLKKHANKEGNSRTIFYCLARYNSVHRVIEDEQHHKNIEVKVVDSSHISVELLKKNPELHPVRYVDIDDDATISSPFNSVVVGFGEVGLDAVRFLYEFGAFVQSGIDDVKRSEFHCYVFDKNMNDLAGLFKINTPSIKSSLYKGAHATDELIHLYQMDCRSIEFYEKIKELIANLNYVVVATGDDEMNISLAVRILQLAIRKREDKLDHLRILVRIQHDEGGHIEKIKNHYNRLWTAEKVVFEQKDKKHQNKISSTECIDTPITLFGYADQVYTYDNVIKEALKDDAKRFKRMYDSSVNELRKAAGMETYPLQDWDEEKNDMMQLSGIYEGFMPTYSSVMKLRRIQYQNIANSLHKETKIFMAREALGANFDCLKTHGLVRAAGTTKYSWRDNFDVSIDHIQRVIDILAQTEHLRWMASHEILGYEDMRDENYKDEARLKHGCLKDWSALSTEMKSNDYDVVDVSLGIIEQSNTES